MRAPELLTEAQFQERVIDLAHVRGWLVHHVRPARTPDGKYLTRIAGDAGFPDLVLARGGTVIFAELKSMTGSASGAQLDWLEALGPDAVIWRPSSWALIEAMLR